MDRLVQDLHYAVRQLRKSPGFTAIAVVTLALGIGANTAVFSAVNAFFLRPLPVQNAGRLVVLAARQQGISGSGSTQVSYPDFNEYRKQLDASLDLLAYQVGLVGVSDRGPATQTLVSYITANFFSSLGLRPVMGRFIAGSQTEGPEAEPGIVLGYSFWKSRFNGAANIVGTQVKVNGVPFTIVGVAPAEFTGLYSIVDMQAYLPLGQEPRIEGSVAADVLTNRDQRALKVLGVLRPGIDINEARASANVVAKRLARQYPETDKGMSIQVSREVLSRPEPVAGNDMLVGAAMFMLLAGVVLLLACANTANLLLVRANTRRREMAIRAALGGAGRRLVRQLLTESILLALLGGIAGILVGQWASAAISSIRLDSFIPFRFDFSFDWRVFAFSAGAALFTGILVGLAPALRVSSVNVGEILHESGRGSSAPAMRNRLRSALVVVQVAGSFVLLIVAGLFLRSLMNAQRTYVGFDPDHVLNLSMDPHLVGYDETRGRAFYRELENRVRALPGVQTVALATTVPLGFIDEDTRVYIPGRSSEDKEPAPTVLFNSIEGDYFRTLQIGMLQGRDFTDADNDRASLVAIVNQTMANRFWPGENALGKRFSMKGPTGPFIEIIGVARDCKYLGPLEDPRPYFYVPLAQNYESLRTLQIRSTVPPESLIPATEQQVHSIASDMPTFDVRAMNQSLNSGNGFVVRRAGTDLTLAMGLLGLTLAVVGVYSVVSYASSQRTHEIGIRMALGAGRARIERMILRQGFLLIAVGIAIGLGVALAVSRVVVGVFRGVSATDPLTFVSVTVLLLAAALAGCLLPARRATRVDPMIALRYE